MKHPERLEDYLKHIAEAIDRAASYLAPLPNIDAFRKNPQVQDAVVRNIEIIGEAVTKIQKIEPDFIKHHSDIPWARMRTMRNIAIHEYFFVDLQIVWDTVKDHLPKLRQQIDRLLTDLKRDSDPDREQ